MAEQEGFGILLPGFALKAALDFSAKAFYTGRVRNPRKGTIGMNIQIIGLGLIGGSLCKALKKYTGHRVLGMDTDPVSVAQARAQGVIDEEGTEATLAQADLAVVCLHPEAAISFLLGHRQDFRKGGIVCDVCGVKGAVVQAVSRPLAEEGVRFVGCHPMAGREFSGFGYALADLFSGASFILTPVEGTDPAAVETISALTREIGFGKVVTASPEEHDRIIAATSQLAHVVSNAYIKSPTLREEAGFSAGSYLDLTRVAKLNEDMWASLFLMNRDALLFELDTILASLAEYREALANQDAPALKALLREGRELKEGERHG